MDAEYMKEILSNVDRNRIMARMCVLLRTNQISIETFVRQRKKLLRFAQKAREMKHVQER